MMLDRLDDPELCEHVRADMREGDLFGWHWSRFLFRRCPQCEREAHDAWIEHVRSQLIAGLQAAAEDKPFQWEPDPREVASEQIGSWYLVRVGEHV